ncbi:MAG TPA: hypothetical protein VH877_24035 [Polyangia bacterium]|nr:hypothetical protein [Polyangia bacterium]
MRALIGSVLMLLVAMPSPWANAEPQKKPRYYMVVRAVEGAKEVAPEQVRQIFTEELAKHPEDCITERAEYPKEPEALAARLATEKLTGYLVTVRILEITRELVPAAAGKPPMLQRGVRLTVIGASIPEDRIAFGGHGDALTGTIMRGKPSEAEAASLLSDAIRYAISQAVDESLKQLHKGSKSPSAAKRP